MNALHWQWIALMATLPGLAVWLVAVPFWRQRQFIFGNVVGAGVVFVSALAMIFREYLEIRRVTQACLDAGTTCWPDPSAFTRYAIYAAIGLVEVIAIFSVSLTVERRMDNRDYAPQWRR